MKRITAVVKTSEVTGVRKAIFAAGGSRIVVATVPHRVCRVELADWYCGTPDADRSDYVRLDVTVDDDRSGEVVSAIIAATHSGMVERIAFLPTRVSRVSRHLLTECAA